MTFWMQCTVWTTIHAQANRTCIVITGLGGLPEYEENFIRWGGAVAEACGKEPGSNVYSLDGRQQKKNTILQTFNQIQSSTSLRELWFFLIGHANHDGQNYKFNISGPDLTDTEIKKFISSLGGTRTYIIAATSASGVLASDLSQQHRVIVTATKSRFERQPPLFMSFFIEAVTSAEADTDKNGKVSLLEAFLFSDQKVSSWFEEKGRIQTEHSLLDDNGQARLNDNSEDSKIEASAYGTLLAATAYLSTPPEQSYRSLEARELAAERVLIEREIADLKFRKNQIPEENYYNHLEEFLVKLATINEKIQELEGQR